MNSDKNTPPENKKAPQLVTDNLVTGKNFEIRAYKKGILKTFPVPENLGKYYESEHYISHTDSKRTFQDKVYQKVKSYMLSQKANWIRNISKGTQILDYGCGTGDFLLKMQKLNWEVSGIEPNDAARNLAQKKCGNVQSSLHDLKNQKFDVITLWHVLEHIPDFEGKLDEFKKLLKPNGLLIIAVPNYKSYDAKYYKKFWAAWDVPRHLWHFSRKGILEIMKSKNFKCTLEKGLQFDSFYVSMLSENNKASKPNLLNAFYRGLISNLKAKQTKEYSSIAYFFVKN